MATLAARWGKLAGTLVMIGPSITVESSRAVRVSPTTVLGVKLMLMEPIRTGGRKL
jgi:hypothetical protein